MKISQAGLTMIENFEGFRERAYKCAAGVWTIGFGTTRYSTGMSVKQNERITREKAEKELKIYIERNVYPQLESFSWLNQSQFDSLCSLLYNIGAAGAGLKSSLYSKNISRVKESMMQYTKAAGKVIKGLEERRKVEVKSFDSKIRVRVFQSLTTGLEVDGICGKKTKAAIPLLQKGSRGDYVKMVQRWLGAKEDGIFGNDTKRFVIDFQTRNHLTADGIIGEKTMLSLFGL